ncbi:binuclear zinc transcription factor [Metarhizium acridum CQMa 102]|uniref:Binuclear zinc transcription factor n=1 Tax=Metarhizium acridum (strain CQMa 102) TaxID=655827 RepID=E9E570_METAQ|nr:binuclear zinc transcription factor [Metarhizium acridum CQMa 102]EFY88945.1 binuclear zinc transcription factor [Metarhizium acridum CQMa 102]
MSPEPPSEPSGSGVSSATEPLASQVESYLKEVNKGVDEGANSNASQQSDPPLWQGDFTFESGPTGSDAADSQQPKGTAFSFPDFSATQEDTFMGDGSLIGLGYSETLPPLEVQEDLNNTFFLVPYHFIPIIHSGRYYRSFYAGPLRKTPMSLQYAIWAMAANGHARYDQYSQVFNQRARQYIEADEMKDHGEHFITIAHAQALCLVAAFEAKCMLFTRASTSCAKAVRLCQMMGLDRLDGARDDLPPALGPHSTWEELEERRRVFWGAFAIDSHASISTGWPALINPDDVMTRLPASEEAFSSGKEEVSPFLDEIFSGASFSSFAGTLVVCSICRVILKHVHRSKPTDNPEDVMEGPFWKRHRDLDNQLSSIFMFLPARFRLPRALRDPAAIHMNLNLHAAVIILHHAALEKANLHDLGENVKRTSLCRLRTSAEEIVNIVKMSSHSTSIFAMEAIGRNHEVTCAFLQQACSDIERNGLASVLGFPNLEKYRSIFGGANNSNIPLISRSSISKHSKVMPVLPGRLPLNNPQGKILPGHLKLDKGLPPLTSRGPEPVVRELINSDCFQPILGAVTRNVGAGPRDRTEHKRKRMSPSASPSVGLVGTTMHGQADETPGNGNQATAFGAAPGVDMRNPLGDASFILPDRTNSSTSSPAYRAGGSDPLSGSSHTSPPGLGNTPEENRFDLRVFQERMFPQMWQAAQMQSMQDTLFTSSVTEALFTMAGIDETTAGWESWNESAAWQTDMSGS